MRRSPSVPGTYDTVLRGIGESLQNLHTLYNFFNPSSRNYFSCIHSMTTAAHCDKSRYGRVSEVISAFVSGLSPKKISLQRLPVISWNILPVTVSLAGEPLSVRWPSSAAKEPAPIRKVRRCAASLTVSGAAPLHTCVMYGGRILFKLSIPSPTPSPLLTPIQKLMQRFRLDDADRPDGADKILFNNV